MTSASSLIIGMFLPNPNRLISLSISDMVIIAVYFVMVLGIGIYLKKYATSGEDFFLAGREMTAWVAGLSFISANLGAIELLGWAASAYEYGMLAAHAYWIGALPAIVLLALVMMPFYYLSKTHSVPGYLQLRYGEDTRALTGISFAVITVLMSGINMYAMALVLKVVVGWNIHFSIWVSSLTVAIYVALGGLFSAIFNEVLQFFLIWLGALLIPILGLVEVGGWSGMVARIHANFPVGDYTHLWRAAGNLFREPHGHPLDRNRLCLGWRTLLRLLDNGLPGDSADAGCQESPRGENGAPHRRLLQNDRSDHRHPAGLAGAGRSPLQARAGKCHGAGAAQLQRTIADHAGALLWAGPAGFGDYGPDCRIHVGDGGERYRLRDGVDV